MQQIRHEFKCNLPSSSFTKTEGGEYCSACKTVVIDFTNKSNEEILQILSANGGNACGSAFGDQFSEHTSSWRLRNKVAVAGLAAMLGLTPEIAKAQSADTVKTEIVAPSNNVRSFDTIAATNNATSSPAIDAPEKPDKKKEVVKKKTFLRIGHRRFYTMNVFPFLGTSRIRKGMYVGR